MLSPESPPTPSKVRLAVERVALMEPERSQLETPPTPPRIGEIKKPDLATSDEWQWRNRKRPYTHWDKRAIEVLRLGLLTSEVIERIVVESLRDFERLTAIVGVSRISTDTAWPEIQQTFWRARASLALESLTGGSFLLVPANHPALPRHLSQVSLRITTEASWASASTPSSSGAKATLTIRS